ncbi:hypothetical protein PN474_19445 [Nodularia spumigena CS-589/07]|uniref:hypothetical protein n=1 Tax=Nodularia spumigena TaxID=70799 RepID=UPI0023315903|nr:hypothetical protein [Nodularia spumigena]MDB9341365.1 hypothetical protein [Nodularia spumigena CS-589/07]
MQIIQPFLGNQSQPLGLTSYLGQHQQLSFKSQAKFLHKNSNFIKPIVTTKPLIKTSQFLLSRKHKPIDTLIDWGDGDNQDFPVMSFDERTEVNETNNVADQIGNIGNISNILQAQIASSLNEDNFTKTPIKPKITKKSPKAPRNKTSQSKPKSNTKSPAKAKTTKKTSAAKKNKQVSDTIITNINPTQQSILLPDSSIPNQPESEITTFNPNLPLIPDNFNLSPSTTDNDAVITAPIPFEEESTLMGEISNDEPPVSTDLAFHGNNAEILPKKISSKQDAKFDIAASEVSESAPIEYTLPNVGESINILNNIDNNEKPVIGEELPPVDELDISVVPKTLQQATNYPITTSENTGVPINEQPQQSENATYITTQKKLLDSNNSLDEITAIAPDFLTNINTISPIKDDSEANDGENQPSLPETQEIPTAEITPSLKSETQEIPTAEITPSLKSDTLAETPDIGSKILAISDVIPAVEPPNIKSNTLPLDEVPLTLKETDTKSETVSDTPFITEVVPGEISPEIPPIMPDITSAISPKNQVLSTSETTQIMPTISDSTLPNINEKTHFSKIDQNKQIITPESPLTHNLDSLENSTFEENEENTSSIEIEQNPALDNLPAPKGYATGGQVTASSVQNDHPLAPSDTVPAMLTPGEFVINAKDAQKNLPILRQINRGSTPEEIVLPNLETPRKTEGDATSQEPPTKVQSFSDSSRPRQNSEQTALGTASLGVDIGKQRNSMLHPPEINTIDNTTHNGGEPSAHYSSPAMIFRKANSQTNSQTPSQWSSIEELLNPSNEQFSAFDFGSVESSRQDSDSSQVSKSSLATPQKLAQRLPLSQGFANGGEVTAPDISRDIAPITQTIQTPNSNVEEDSEDDDDEKLEALAYEIYQRLRQKLEIERERQGKYMGRLPW